MSTHGIEVTQGETLIPLPGKIIETNPDGTYNIGYENGGFEANVDPDRVRPIVIRKDEEPAPDT